MPARIELLNYIYSANDWAVRLASCDVKCEVSFIEHVQADKQIHINTHVNTYIRISTRSIIYSSLVSALALDA